MIYKHNEYFFSEKCFSNICFRVEVYQLLMVGSCTADATRPDTQCCTEVDAYRHKKMRETENCTEKEQRDGTERDGTEMEAGAGDETGGGGTLLRSHAPPRV